MTQHSTEGHDPIQSCGHPRSAIESSDEGTSCCRECEAEARAEGHESEGQHPDCRFGCPNEDGVYCRYCKAHQRR